MRKLALHYDQEISGEFELKKLNFLFTFQVNCPGCFLYGIPLVNKLVEQYGEQVSFLGVSTAFEDFDFNTLHNTERLVKERQVVGETKKALAQSVVEEHPVNIDFPVAMDRVADASFDLNEAATSICLLNPNYVIWPKSEQAALHEKVMTYLDSLPSIPLTFTLNQFRGTPTMVVFNDDYEVLVHHFGHVDYQTLKEEIESCLRLTS